jgi:hypothetical protein
MLPSFTHTPVGMVGAQLYPGDIAAQHRNPHEAAPTRTATGRTRRPLSDNEDCSLQRFRPASFTEAARLLTYGRNGRRVFARWSAYRGMGWRAA